MFELASCTSYPILSERPLIASSKWILVCSAGGMGSSPVPVQSRSCEWGRESSRRSEHREVILHSDAHSTQMHSDALRCTQRHSEALRGTQRHSEALRGTQRHSEALRGTFHMHSRWTQMSSLQRSPASRVKRREDDRARRSDARRSAPTPQKQPSCPGGYIPCTPVYESHRSGVSARSDPQMALGWYSDDTQIAIRCLG